MRTTIAIATFLAVGAGAVGVGAVTLKLRGSDTLKATTVALLNTNTFDCGGVGNVPAGLLDYEGTGSGNGQAAMQNPAANKMFIAPMSRAMNNGICPSTNTGLVPGNDVTKSEGIVFELDGLTIAAKGTSVPLACNAAQDTTCTQQSAGLAFNKTVTPIGQGCDLAAADACPAGDICSNPTGAALVNGKKQGVCAHACTAAADCNDPTRPGVFGEACNAATFTDAGGTAHTGSFCGYTFPTWKEPLRILFFGMSDPAPASGSTFNNRRNCGSPERQYLADHYYSLFQSACSTANCTNIEHLFRRNDESGTTDVFVGSLSVQAITQSDNQVAFCNAGTQYPSYTKNANTAGCAADTDCPGNGGSTGPASMRPASMGTYSNGTPVPYCASANAGATMKRCDFAQPCASDSDCGATQTIGGACAGATDNTQCAPVPLHACSKVNAAVDPGNNTVVNRCIATRLFMACQTDADCGSTHNFSTNTSTPIPGSCAPDTGSLTGKSCIRGATAQQPVSDNDAFLPAPASTLNPKNTPTTIIMGTDLASVNPAYRGEYFVDLQDHDVIRRKCQGAGKGTEQVCSVRGDLGLLLPVWDVPNEEIPTADAYPTTQCVNNLFECAPATRLDTNNTFANAVYALCVDGEDPNLTSTTSPTIDGNTCPHGQCPVPIVSAGERKCINGNTSNPSGITLDGRSFNLTTWTGAAGAEKVAQVTRATGLLNSPKFGSTAPSNMVGAFYRIHATNSFTAGITCQATSATVNIGCFVQGSPCSLGYAGNAAVDGTNAIAVKVNGIDPVDTCVRKLVVPGSSGLKYPIARKLYLNALDGFEALDPGNGGSIAAGSHAADVNAPDELKLTNCYANGTAGTVATGLGFTSLPSTLNQSFCEDFNEVTQCTAFQGATACPGGVPCVNVNACANNNGSGTTLTHVPTCQIDGTGTPIPAGCVMGN